MVKTVREKGEGRWETINLEIPFMYFYDGIKIIEKCPQRAALTYCGRSVLSKWEAPQYATFSYYSCMWCPEREMERE